MQQKREPLFLETPVLQDALCLGFTMGHFRSFIHLKLIFIGRGVAKPEPIAMAK